MRYSSMIIMLMCLFLLAGCQDLETVRYVKFQHSNYQEVSPHTYLFDGDYIYFLEKGQFLEISFSFIDATMELESNGDFIVTFEQGTMMSCINRNCVTQRVGTVPYDIEDFKELASGVQTDTGSGVSALSPGIVLLTIIFSFASLFCIVIATSFDRTKGMLEILNSMNWRFRGDVEPSDAYVFYTMFSLWLIPIFTVFWFIFFIL